MYTIYKAWLVLTKYLEIPIFHFLSIFSRKLGWKFRLWLVELTYDLSFTIREYAEYDREYYRQAVNDIIVDLYYIQQARSICKEKLNEYSSSI